MKSKLLFFDLTICSLWMLSMLAGKSYWTYPTFIFVVLEVVYRTALPFVLSRKEKRAWLPLLIFAPLIVMSVGIGEYNGIGNIIDIVFNLTTLNHNLILKYIIGSFFMMWIFVVPYIWYLLLIYKKQLVRTNLTWKDLCGGILWYSRLEKTSSAIMVVMLMAFLVGISMNTRLCLTMCLTAAPLTYWLLCNYYRVKTEKVWVLVVSMAFFWHAQIMAGALRVTMLLACFGLIIYVGVHLYKNTKNCMLTGAVVLYLGFLLPSFTIGYNQYACINYARSDFNHIDQVNGIIHIKDNTGKLYGLRNRYRLLVKPEYEHIYESGRTPSGSIYIYELQKDGNSQYYKVVNNILSQ